MPRREYNAARAEHDGEPLEFVVNGEVFTVPTPISGVSVLDLATEDAGKAFVAYAQFFRDVLDPEDYERFHQVCKRERVELELLIEIANGIIEDGSGRPTEQRSASLASLSNDTPTSPAAATSAG